MKNQYLHTSVFRLFIALSLLTFCAPVMVWAAQQKDGTQQLDHNRVSSKRIGKYLQFGEDVYEVHPVPGDGDCAFHSLGLKRAEVMDRLDQAIDEGDLNIKRVFAGIIADDENYFRHLPRRLRGLDVDGLKTQLNSVVSGEEVPGSTAVFHDYVEWMRDGHLSRTGSRYWMPAEMVQTIAAIHGNNVEIIGNGRGWEHHLALKLAGEDRPTQYLLQSPGHYERLEKLSGDKRLAALEVFGLRTQKDVSLERGPRIRSRKRPAVETLDQVRRRRTATDAPVFPKSAAFEFPSGNLQKRAAFEVQESAVVVKSSSKTFRNQGFGRESSVRRTLQFRLAQLRLAQLRVRLYSLRSRIRLQEVMRRIRSAKSLSGLNAAKKAALGRNRV